MNKHTRKEIAERFSITGSDNSGWMPALKLRIELPGVRQESSATAPSSRKPKSTAVAGWVILILLFAFTGTFWATNQLSNLAAQKMQEVQRQRYHPQIAYSDLWDKSRR